MIRAVVVGATGYTGAECVSVLLRHAHAAPVGLFGSLRRGSEPDASPRLDELFPRFRSLTDLRTPAFDLSACLALKPDVVFLATPHEASHEIAPELLKAGVVVIDLSAAFRFRDADVFAMTYGFTHSAPALLEQAVYGLPELNKHAIAKAQLIAAPGCYPTSAIIPLNPLKRAGALDPARPPIIDSVSGVSGAGRSLQQSSLFCEVSLQPYKVFAHRHTPEIAEQVGADVIFTPHLGAFDRGILSTIHADLAPGWTETRVRDLLIKTYAGQEFVRVLPAGAWPSVAAVRNSNWCDIGLAVDETRSHLIVVSAIDNLLKGAAGQAAQCMNIRFGLPESAGLTQGTA